MRFPKTPKSFVRFTAWSPHIPLRKTARPRKRIPLLPWIPRVTFQLHIDVAYRHRNNLRIVQQRNREKIAQVVFEHWHNYARLSPGLKWVIKPFRKISERPHVGDSFVSLAPINSDLVSLYICPSYWCALTTWTL